MMRDPIGEALLVRDETAADHAAIRTVNRAAFARPDEALLIDALRAGGGLVRSLVALAGDELVGHIAFSPVTITGDRGTTNAIGLAPMAVAPAWQRRGVGARLIGEGLDRLRCAGHRAVVVLGHPDYYPRLGFIRASRLGLRWEHPARDEAFMAIELVPGALAGGGGVVRFRREFDAVS
jgi:putative acetyltransferase